MKKLFCDECGREINVTFASHSITLDDSTTERRTRVSFEVKGQEYFPNDDKHAKSPMIEHLCKKCTIKYIKAALGCLKEEYEWDGKE